MFKDKHFLLLLLAITSWISNADSKYENYDPIVYDTTKINELPNCLKPENDEQCTSLCSETILCIERKECVCISKITQLLAHGYLGYLPEDESIDSFKKLIPESVWEPPILRHHIAHFCPNLDVARQCIKKCMESGKPAFCGKDHVCYCGHKGEKKDKTVDAREVYAQFQDLYTKYFGPRESDESRSE